MPATGPLSYFWRFLDGLAHTASDQWDCALLERFVHERDEVAFATLVARHGPLVLSVCRRVLQNHHDAEDAFQATFLVLARRAGSIRRRQALASWLYQVAYRIACSSRAGAVRSRERLREIPMSTPVPRDPAQGMDDAAALALLDNELLQLPEKYRSVLVLCDLQGRTHQEAAESLGCPAGSVWRRLTRARELLRRRLTGHGVATSGGFAVLQIAVQQAQAALTPGFVAITAQAALRFIGLAGGVAPTPSAVLLAKGALQSMFLTKLKLFLTCVLVGSALALSGAAFALYALHDNDHDTQAPSQIGAGSQEKQEKKPKEKAGKWEERLQIDINRGKPAHAIWPAVAFSADGGTIAAKGAGVYFYEVATKKLTAAHDNPPGATTDTWMGTTMTFALKGPGFAATDLGGVAIWEKPGAKNPARLDWGVPDRPRFRCNTTCFSKDLKLLAAGWGNGNVQVWKLDSLWQQKKSPQKPSTELKETDQSVTAVTFGLGAKNLVAGYVDGGASVWDVGTGKSLATFASERPAAKGPPDGSYALRAVSCSADGRTIAVVNERGVRLLEIASQKELAKVNFEKKPLEQIFSAVFSPDRKKLAVGWSNGTIKIWDLTELWQKSRPPEKESDVLRASADNPVAALAFSTDARLLAACTSNGNLKVWEHKTD